MNPLDWKEVPGYEGTIIPRGGSIPISFDVDLCEEERTFYVRRNGLILFDTKTVVRGPGFTKVSMLAVDLKVGDIVSVVMEEKP